jgi:hypothetical protein
MVQMLGHIILGTLHGFSSWLMGLFNLALCYPWETQNDSIVDEQTTELPKFHLQNVSCKQSFFSLLLVTSSYLY